MLGRFSILKGFFIPCPDMRTLAFRFPLSFLFTTDEADGGDGADGEGEGDRKLLQDDAGGDAETGDAGLPQHCSTQFNSRPYPSVMESPRLRDKRGPYTKARLSWRDRVSLS